MNKNINKRNKQTECFTASETFRSIFQDSNWNFAPAFSFKNRLPVTRYALRLFLLIFSLVLVSSCSLFEEDKGNYLTGKINYLGSSGDKNVSVSLYNYPQINDTLLNLSIQYPDIGAKISRELLFDKNTEPAVKSVNASFYLFYSL